jgi:glycosyltransferase involved in cell wall biosynthesis
MNILMLAPHPGVRGPVPKHTPILVEGLRALGAAITLEPWGRHHDREGVAAKLTSRFGDIRRVRRRLREDAYDLLVVKTAHDWNTLVRDIALLRAVRGLCPAAVLQFHGSDPAGLASLPRWHPFRIATSRLMDLADGALVLSSEEKRQWEAAFPRARFEVVKNPFVPLPPVETHPNADPDPVFLFVGRLMAEKGVFETLEAFARLRVSAPARLVIAGDGPAADQVRARAESLGLADAVRVTGYLGPEELARAYARADVFVLPTYWKEGCPTAILEAMQAGLPVITTALRGAADYLEEGVHALFVPPRDPAMLVNAMESLRADPSLRRRLGDANREKLKEFSRDPVARGYRDALERIMAGRATG